MNELAVPDLRGGRGGLDGRVAVVTGATGGIGRAIVEELTALGAKVRAVARSEDNLRALAAEGAVSCLAADLSEEAECRRVIDVTVEELGAVDVLVNNAGIGSAGEGRIWEQESDHWRLTMAVNLDAPFHLTRYASRTMVDRGWGRIVMVASTVAEVAFPAPGYCASKAGLLGLMRAAAVDVGAHNVTCNAVCPGYVRTDMAERSAQWLADRRGVSTEEIWVERAALYPAGRVLEPREIAAAVGFLSSPAASGINGAAITIALGGLL